MANKIVKLDCYVDETGQDTDGKFYLVSVILSEQVKREELEQVLESIEKKTGKNKTKWSKSSFEMRKKFLLEIMRISPLHRSIYYSRYSETKEYTNLTGASIAKAVQAKGERHYAVSVIVDGLTKKDQEKIRKILKKMGIKYKKIRGMKDEQSVFIRLADYIAGFIRDWVEGQAYTKELHATLMEKELLVEV